MTPDHEKRLQEIEDRANAASGNKWIPYNPYRDPKMRTRYYEVHCMEIGNEGVCIAQSLCKEDAIFTAHAMEDIPWLMERLWELEFEIHGAFPQLKGEQNHGTNQNDGAG